MFDAASHPLPTPPRKARGRAPYRLALIAALTAGLGLTAIGAASAAGPGAIAVSIDNFTFSPPALTVAAGTKVTWTNNDDIPHTVRAVDGAFGSKAMDSADSYSFTFAKPGVYTYFCSIHPKMVGKVIVK
jgi:plastocyanin